MLTALAAVRAIALGLLAAFGLVTALVATCAFAFAPLFDRRRHTPSVRPPVPSREVSR